MIQGANEGRTQQEKAMDRLRELIETAEQERRYGKLTVTVEVKDGKILVVRHSTEFTEQ
jgi:hypothetical protein